jgi:DNA replication factor GINS
MKLDELQSVQSRERQTDQLQQLRATFYQEAGEFIAQLREERERAAERADDPFDSPEVNRLSNDIKTAEQTVEAVYERRVGKIVKMASLAAADMPTEEDGLTEEERTLFEMMVEAIEQNRQHVLDVVAGEAPTGAVGDGTNDKTSTIATDPEPEVDSGVDAADIMGGGDGGSESMAPDLAGAPSDTESLAAGTEDGTDSSDRPAGEAISATGDDAETPASDETPATEPEAEKHSQTAGDVDRKTVRITDEVGEIFGVDQREYDLSTDDVVTLPADNADPLVERDAAEPLE